MNNTELCCALQKYSAHLDLYINYSSVSSRGCDTMKKGYKFIHMELLSALFASVFTAKAGPWESQITLEIT